jgi:NAD(P)-dependent dehydrogenase (short-subunit alcohol dehydrogenase family)
LSSFGSALVTGGRSGIGAAIVATLEREAIDVLVLDIVDGFDVCDPRAWDEVGAVDLACLNAGVVAGEPDVARVSDEQYRRIVGVNVDGVVFGVRRLAEVMDAGSIVVTASLAGLTATEADPLYALTKHAVVGFVRSAAPVLAARGIRLNMVNPGFVDTPMLDDVGRAAFEAAGFPLLQPEDVAAAVLRAADDEDVGQAWIVQPGREPMKFRFPNLPGPRVAGKEGIRPPFVSDL